MKILIASALLVFAGLAVSGQEVSVMRQGEFVPDETPKTFTFASLPDDIIRGKFIASFKASTGGKKKSIVSAFYDIRKHAMKMKANAFVFQAYEPTGENSHDLVIDAYYIPGIEDSPVDTVYSNKVYIFCDERKSDAVYSIKADNQKVAFRSGTYLEYALTEGQTLKLSKGGFTGMTLFLKYRENKEPQFFSISSFGVGAAPPGVMGASLNTGRFEPVGKNLGLLLINCLERYER